MREDQERFESEYLSPYAARSARSQGREMSIEPCPLRTDFQRDRDRILHCKSFRRLKHKTQCFVAPEDDHYRTRLTHTLEVSQIARTIARALRLNEDLTEAIALGHDLGHTPFGHMGERTLDRLSPLGFRHNEHGLRIVTALEREGQGLNLTHEVRDGIAHHTGAVAPETCEGQVVRLSDRIAYINHDIDDAIRAGLLRESDLPSDLSRILGGGHGPRIDTMILDIVRTSQGTPRVAMSERILEATTALRAFLFERVYLSPRAMEEERRADKVLTDLYTSYVESMLVPTDAPDAQAAVHRAACDYIAGMTDLYAVSSWKAQFLPTPFIH